MKEGWNDKTLLGIVGVLVIMLIVGTLICGGTIASRDKLISELRGAVEGARRELGEIRGIADDASLRLERLVGDVEKALARADELARGASTIERKLVVLTARAEQAAVLLRGVRETIGELFRIIEQTGEGAQAGE